MLAELVGRVTLGRHLVEPWRVVLAGPVNVGKSSLANALAGYRAQRGVARTGDDARCGDDEAGFRWLAGRTGRHCRLACFSRSALEQQGIERVPGP